MKLAELKAAYDVLLESAEAVVAQVGRSDAAMARLAEACGAVREAARRFGRKPTIVCNGYVLRYVGPEHHLASVTGYAYEHRLVMEATLGRRLDSDEIVHHRDGDKQNNDPANLEVQTRSQHRHTHKPSRPRLALCARGHKREYVRPSGKRVCRICRNAAARALRLRVQPRKRSTPNAAKVTESTVRAIRASYAAGGVSQYQLAREYGLTQTNIGMIVRRKTWKGVA